MNFNYEYLDRGKSQTILLLHGFLSSKESMRRVADGLKDIRNVMLVDLPGFGQTKSADIDYSMDTIADGLVSLMKHHDIHQFDVLGYSMGGRTALALTASYPKMINKCILESASPGIIDAEKRAERYKIDSERSNFIVKDYDAFLKFWQDMPLFNSQQRISPELLNAQHQERLTQQPKEAADSLLKYGTGVQRSYWEDLSQLDNDFYLIAGSDDEKFVAVAQSMSERLKSAKLNIVEHAGHNVHLENYHSYIKQVRDYLKEDNS